MKYFPSQMNKLVKEHEGLQVRLKEIMKDLELEKSFALKALYHSEVADGGEYQFAYQDLDSPKRR